MKIDRFCLTADQAAEFHKNGVLEIREMIEPQPVENLEPITKEEKCFHHDYQDEVDHGRYVWVGESWNYPHGDDRRVWIAEPWTPVWNEGYTNEGNKVWICYLADNEEILVTALIDHTYFGQNNISDSMPREAFRADANLITTVEQINNEWWWKIRLEKIDD